MKTFMQSQETARKEQKWFLVNLEDKVLGRQATEIAKILRGKNKAEFTPFIDCGDFVVVVNAEKVRFTGRKWKQKVYYSHSGYPGGIKDITAEELLKKDPESLLYLAVKRMLPKGPLGRQMLRKLKIYKGPEHPHTAQQPQKIEL